MQCNAPTAVRAEPLAMRSCTYRYDDAATTVFKTRESERGTKHANKKGAQGGEGCDPWRDSGMPQDVNERERLPPKHPRKMRDKIRTTTSYIAENAAALMLKQLSCFLLAAVSLLQTLNWFVLQRVPRAKKERGRDQTGHRQVRNGRENTKEGPCRGQKKPQAGENPGRAQKGPREQPAGTQTRPRQ